MIEGERKISTVEGNSFSGKTTLVKELEAEHGFSVVWEPMTYLDKAPQFPPATYIEAKTAIDIFTEVEKRRSVDAVNRLEHTGFTIMDRSIWTYPAFQYVVMKRMPNVPNSYLYSLDVLQKHIEDGKIIVPGAMISLTPSDKNEFQNRIASRGKVGIGFLNDWETTKLMGKWFAAVMNSVYTKNNGGVLASEDNLKEIANKANSFLRESEYSVDIILIFDLLRDLK